MPFGAATPNKSSKRNVTSLLNDGADYHGKGQVNRGKLPLYQEARRMLAAAYLMFIIPDMRELIRKGERMDGDPEMIARVLKCPCTALEVATIFNANLERLKELIQDEDRASMYNQSMDLENPDLPGIHILCVDDENGEKECVYSLAVNHPKKLVSVLFRGSVTTKDFIQDAKAVMADIENPLGDRPNYLGVHLGFKEYLYEVLPWHDMMVPALLRQSLEQSTNVAGKVGKSIMGVGASGVNTVSKGIATVVPKSVLDAGAAGASVLAKGATTASKSVMDVGTAGVGAFSKGVTTGAGMVGSAVGTTAGMIGSTVGTVTGASSQNASTTKEQPAGAVDIATSSTPSGVHGTEQVDHKETALIPTNEKDTDAATNVDEEAPAEPKPEQARKYELIIDQIKQVFEENPDYRLYVGGHSLGGALATVFAFECAATSDDIIPKPVTCITSGAPKVGNIHFLNMFHQLEEDRKMRCLHVANYRDIVTLSPPLPMCCCYGQNFRRVGFHLTLSPHAFVLSYPPTLSCALRFLVDVFKWIRHFIFILLFLPLLAVCGCSTKKFLRAEHTQLMYMNRFDNYRDTLEGVTIDELYRERFAKTKCYQKLFPVIHVGGKKRSNDDDSHTAAQEVKFL